MTPTFDADLESIRVQIAEMLGWGSVGYNRCGYLVGHAPGRNDFQVVPSYARDIKAAWELVDHLSMHGIHVNVQAGPVPGLGRVFAVEIDRQGKRLARAQDPMAALAICRAFLRIPGERLSCALHIMEDPLKTKIPEGLRRTSLREDTLSSNGVVF